MVPDFKKSPKLSLGPGCSFAAVNHVPEQRWDPRHDALHVGAVCRTTYTVGPHSMGSRSCSTKEAAATAPAHSGHHNHAIKIFSDGFEWMRNAKDFKWF